MWYDPLWLDAGWWQLQVTVPSQSCHHKEKYLILCSMDIQYFIIREALFFSFLFAMLGLKPRFLHMLGKHSMSEPHS